MSFLFGEGFFVRLGDIRRTIEVPTSRIVIIEGIYALSEKLRPLLDLRVSVTCGVHFDLVKRVLRDIQRAWQERDMLISKASADIKSSIATIKGLCVLGKKEIDHPRASEYWARLDKTSDSLSAISKTMFYSSKINAPSD